LASVLRSPEIEVTPFLGETAPVLVDQAVAEMLAGARAEALAEGRREGYEQGFQAGRDAAVADAAAAAASIRRAVDEVFEHLQALREEASGSLVRTALDLVGRVIGEVDVEPEQLADRIRAALDELDSPSLEVRVAPDMAGAISAALSDDHRVAVTSDPALAAGECRISGEWCDADLTWEAALRVLREVVGA
jgi:type III secretion protein L